MRKEKVSIKTLSIRNVMNQELNNRAKIINEYNDLIRAAREEGNTTKANAFIDGRNTQELLEVVTRDIFKKILDLSK